MPSATKAAAKVRTALLVRLQAKPGKEAAVAHTFPDDAGRQAHLEGRVAAALMAQAPELLASAPAIEKVEILAAKLPG